MRRLQNHESQAPKLVEINTQRGMGLSNKSAKTLELWLPVHLKNSRPQDKDAMA